MLCLLDLENKMLYKIGDYVRIIADNEWNGLTGIIREKFEETLYIFCVTKPLYLYSVNRDNMSDIELVEI